MKLRANIPLISATLLFALPLFASATTNTFQVSGWVPYWNGATSTADAIAHMSELTQVDPFVYSMQDDGSIKDLGPMNLPPWSTLVATAQADHVLVIPTVMWSNGSAEKTILTNTTSRIALEESIAGLVTANGYDGIEIDFEGKPASLQNYFSTFLMGLKQRLGTKKILACDIEARTPLGDAYAGLPVPPGAGDYANNYTAINKYCDQVRLMTYDQQNVDMALNAAAASSSQLYAPVADPQWVSDVVRLAEQQISPAKIEIGIPTYGYEYDVTAYANNDYNYDIMWTFDPGYATQIEQQYNVQPTRNAADELELTYIPSTATGTAPISSGANNALIAAAAASQYATQLNSHMDFRLLDWPDATSATNKADLAKSLGVHGIAIFKIDGGEDPNIWSAIQGLAGTSTLVAAKPTGGSVDVTLAPLTSNLRIGSTGTQVLILQKILNSDASTEVATSGPGSPGSETATFGLATKAAVENFQLKYRVATPSNPSFGSVGPATRAKLNAVLATI
ncbi:MAG TPA: glycosyl hydrolase family 18 protein [Candidatus Paceibacterota bacterium]|jgi:spore germination protein YaaH|nr:glycosyl hydrolase family 18 protein [Candidatus Paceibacterota bacterium]